ncbi:DinB family protein [Aestuariivita boseongensis]|uniref:DinB family protein n=1 Tax=Aestuariivita boseongensis TaxID=1470562 RepID=UPI0006818069|nr:DinB family protein [Aestuariivita boseongensis]
MITPAYAQMMARYNAWQNQWMFQAVDALDEAAREADRGLFWGSIRGTLSHLLWADMMWMSRFDGGEAPARPLTETGKAYDWPALMRGRPTLDSRIAAWSWSVAEDAFEGDLTWYSGALGRDMSKPYAMCVAHFFNHQTHHRGQVHAALTALGVETVDTDIPFMPDEAPEWR